ncbi:Redoxin-domain-containing protein [Lipomyces japonicus]|uniref:Redoxin-domain-containing protein n=1 Tax=Lipomyces japonicus TaxID=56871 RepID=UPI0034CF89A5
MMVVIKLFALYKFEARGSLHIHHRNSTVTHFTLLSQPRKKKMASLFGQPIVRRQILKTAGRRRQFHASVISQVKVGQAVPKKSLYEQGPGDEVSLADLTSKGKSILVFVPGAFSPGCSARHVPGYVSLANEFITRKGVGSIYVISGNDAFVTNAWGKELGTADGKVRYLADPSLSFVKQFNLDFDASKFFGNHRSKRAAVVIEDGVVTNAFVEPDSTGISISEAKSVIENI